MNRFKNLQRWTIFAVICALLFSPMQFVQAQDLKTITATGTMTGWGGEAMPLNITFPPTGGKVTGSVIYQINSDLSCPGTFQNNLEGTFAGGDGGSVTGTASGTLVMNCGNGDITSEATGPWSGFFYANGTGNGVFDYAGSAYGQPINGQMPWQVTFSAEEFQAAPPVQITSKYIFTKYGIRVEDSFGGDEYDQTAWSDHELSLLNDVLKELPPGFLNHIALTRIVRNKVSIDADGNPKPGTCGAYFRCEEKTDPKCTGSLTTIRIFDSAATALPDFPNDPDKQFKSTILHEITHAYQTYKDGNSIYIDSNKSPLSVNYKDATRPDTTLEAVRNGGWEENGWGWYPVVGWYLYGAPGNWPPTNYGRTKPGEDMSESVKMYVYDPQRLQTSSMQRYNFIKDQMFGGIEYENGIQKKP